MRLGDRKNEIKQMNQKWTWPREAGKRGNKKKKREEENKGKKKLTHVKMGKLAWRASSQQSAVLHCSAEGTSPPISSLMLTVPASFCGV